MLGVTICPYSQIEKTTLYLVSLALIQTPLWGKKSICQEQLAALYCKLQRNIYRLLPTWSKRLMPIYLGLRSLLLDILGSK